MNKILIFILLAINSCMHLVYAQTLSEGKDIYQKYCSGCHETGTGNAPKRSDAAFWQKRLEAVVGRSALTNTVITGKGAMPPKGGCATCTEDQLHNAVLYLVNPAPTVTNTQKTLPLEKLKLPTGFKIDIFADDLPGSRFMTRGDKGTIFVGTKGADGTVYALIPKQNSQNTAHKIKLLTDLDEPNGVAFYDGDLYVAEVGRILKYANIESHLDKVPQPIVINDTLPKRRWHGYKSINISPDNQLYVSIGMPCNTCNYRATEPKLGSIMRMQLDGSDAQSYAIGVRNSLGFDWHPKTHDLWFSDNGQDLLGDNIPPDEINYAPRANMDFGFPYVYGNNVITHDYVNKKIDITKFTPPAWELPAHVAALGLKFYTGTQFPKQYQNQLLVALHGSWNRSQKSGYAIYLLTLDKNKIIAAEPFITGWLQNEIAWGRPVDLLVQSDGSLLISDDLNGVIYRVTYK